MTLEDEMARETSRLTTDDIPESDTLADAGYKLSLDVLDLILLDF